MRASWVAVALVLLAAAPAAHPWGNGSGANPQFPSYGVHDAIAHVAYEKLRAASPEAAEWIAHWFLPNPGGYAGSYNFLHLWPQADDNFLGWTDDPDSDLQDWCNHLYLVHPRPDANEQCAPAHAAVVMDRIVANLTLWKATGRMPCGPFEHAAAYNAGLLAHYVGDLSQFGHTDDTSKDHSHPAADPEDRTYHGYYESAVWSSPGLTGILADQRSRPHVPHVVQDVEAAVRALAVRTNMPDGVTVTYVDRDHVAKQVGSQYRTMLTTYVSAYDSGATHLGMRGFTPALWALTTANVQGSVDLVADLLLTAWTRAAEPPVPVLQLPGLPLCPNQA